MKTSRRNFLKQAGAGVGGFSILPSLSWWTLFAVKHPEPPTWVSLVEVARWCPTVHNLQPHRVKVVSETRAELYYEPKSLLPIGDPKSIFATVAMGIFIEHLCIAAAACGYTVEVTEVAEPITTEAKSTTLFAKLQLSPSRKKEAFDAVLIEKRRTARTPYNGEALRPETLQKLALQARAHQQSFYFTEDPSLIDMVVELNQKTLFEDLESAENRKELDQLFRYNRQAAAAHKDGLWAKCMGFSGALMKSVFQQHEKWTKGIKRNLLARKYAASFGGTSTFCFIKGSFNTPSDWLACGRFFARHWLLLTQEGAYLQPVGSLITNANAYKTLQANLPAPSDENTLWIAYRAGYCSEPTRSYRLSTSELML